MREKGFTLVELLVVLLLVGMGSAMVLPSMDRWLRESEVRQSALELAATARSLRHRAIQENRTQRLVVHPAENSYEAFKQKKFLSSETGISSLKGGEPLDEGLRQFLFFPNGSMLGGEIGVSSREGSRVYLVHLDSLTGRVVVAREDRR